MSSVCGYKTWSTLKRIGVSCHTHTQAHPRATAEKAPQKKPYLWKPLSCQLCVGIPQKQPLLLNERLKPHSLAVVVVMSWKWLPTWMASIWWKGCFVILSSPARLYLAAVSWTSQKKGWGRGRKFVPDLKLLEFGPQIKINRSCRSLKDYSGSGLGSAVVLVLAVVD